MSESRSSEVKSTLFPYLGSLCLTDGENQSELVAQSLAFSANLLELDSWEREKLEMSLLHPDLAGDDDRTPHHISQGAAYQARVLSQFERLDELGAADIEALSELTQQLIDDAAMGLALLEEIQYDINLLVVGGDVEEARRLTEFRNKIGKSVRQLRQQIGNDAFDEAEKRAAPLVDLPEGAARAAASLGPMIDRTEESDAADAEKPGDRRIGRGMEADREDADARRAKRKRQAEAESRKGARKAKSKQRRRNVAKPMGLLLVVLIAVWGVLIAPQYFKPAPVQLTEADMSAFPIVNDVIARHPSLFLVVDARMWGELSHDGRVDVVNRIGAQAEQAAYVGVQLRTPDSRTVASWNAKQGAKLVTPAEE